MKYNLIYEVNILQLWLRNLQNIVRSLSVHMKWLKIYTQIVINWKCMQDKKRDGRGVWGNEVEDSIILNN